MLDVLNPPNRRIRFRMYGGVGGAESQDSPLSRLTVRRRGGYQRSFDALVIFSPPPVRSPELLFFRPPRSRLADNSGCESATPTSLVHSCWLELPLSR